MLKRKEGVPVLTHPLSSYIYTGCKLSQCTYVRWQMNVRALADERMCIAR